MISTIDAQLGEKLLEIGTGSGNQSAYLSNLTDKAWTHREHQGAAERTCGICDKLIARGYTEYYSINSKHAAGYYTWEEGAPSSPASSMTSLRRCLLNRGAESGVWPMRLFCNTAPQFTHA